MDNASNNNTMDCITPTEIKAQTRKLFDHLKGGHKVTSKMLQNPPFNFTAATARISDIRRKAPKEGYKLVSERSETENYKIHWLEKQTEEELLEANNNSKKFKPSIVKTGDFEIAVGNGAGGFDSKIVYGIICGDFGAEISYASDWDITHIPTGFIAGKFKHNVNIISVLLDYDEKITALLDIKTPEEGLDFNLKKLSCYDTVKEQVVLIKDKHCGN